MARDLRGTLLLRMEFRLRRKSRRQPSGSERKVIRHLNFDAALRREFVSMTVRIYGSSRYALRGEEFGHAYGQTSRAFAEAGYCLLQMLDVFIHAQRAQMFHRVGLDLFVLRGLVGRGPQHPCGLILAGMLRHLRRQNLQEGMSVRNLRAPGKRFGGFLVVLKLRVVDEAEVVVEPPV